METYTGCISSRDTSKYITQEFIDNPIFELLPDGFDICYYIQETQDNMILLQFYLYDNNKPLDKILTEGVISSMHMYYKKPHSWSYSWVPIIYNIFHIPELVTNNSFKGFNFQGSGIGSFMVLCGISYAKTQNLHFALLTDASARYRKERNIYRKLGFNYIDDKGKDMMGNVNEIYDQIDSFISQKGIVMRDKLTEYLSLKETQDRGRPFKKSRTEKAMMKKYKPKNRRKNKSKRKSK